MGRCAVLLWVALSTACVDANSVDCADVLCPAGNVCHAIHGCVLPAQIDVCSGAADHAPCVTSTVPDGLCYDDVCLPTGCGNAIIDLELGEVCDDGNRAANDGCSADCRSDELCGNHVIDQVKGEGCDDGNTVDSDGCQANCQLPTCGDHHVDDEFGENCDEGDANSMAEDAVCRPNCQPQRCGDTVTDHGVGEVCDDGNLIPGDGCTPDCSSDETCGNGITDFFVHEQCDDRDNHLAHDGCAGDRCIFEDPTWGAHEPTVPSRRSLPAIAYDSRRDRVVLFDGTKTWQLLGGSWALIATPHQPPARGETSMAYDAKRGVMVMFGGYGYGDTWTFDGLDWRNATPVSGSPSARRFHAMAYDPRRERVVLMGGFQTDQAEIPVGDGVYEWDGTSWSHPLASSVNKLAASMSYDATLGAMLIFGGTDTTDNYEAEILTWNGTTLAALPAPGAVAGTRIVFDANRGKSLFIEPTRDVYELVGGTTWSFVGQASWSTRAYAGFVARPRRGDLVMFGGQAGGIVEDSSPKLDETYRGGPLAWTRLDPMTLRAFSAGAAYDLDRGYGVAFSGEDNAYNLAAATYRYVEREWRTVSPAASPPARRNNTMVYDESRHRIVMFGGDDSTLGFAARNDTWTYDGTTWAPLASAMNPSPRAGASMVFDRAHGVVVMFGGLTMDGFVLVDDTWLLDATGWHPASPTAHPSARANAGMVFDPTRGRVVLFGGSASSDRTVWEWDGTTWTSTASADAPLDAYVVNAVFDPARGRSLVFGGATSAGDEMFEWDGVRWRPIESPVPKRYGAAAFYDARESEVAYGLGFANSIMLPSTATFQYGATSGEGCRIAGDGDRDGLAGCADPDCWGSCTPHCPPGAINCDPAQPRCGDGACGAIETAYACPADCGSPPVRCGDLACAATESAATCPGDCP